MKKSMIRIMAVLLMAAMVMSLAGCSKTAEEPPKVEIEKPDETKAKGEKPVKEESKEEASETSETSETSENSENSETSTETPDDAAPPTTAAPATAGEMFTTAFWSASIPAELILDEDWSYEGSNYAYHYFEDKDETFGIDIKVIDEKDLSFRKTLVNKECDLHDYAENKLPVTQIAGYSFVTFEQNYFGTPSVSYLCRLSENGLTLDIEVDNPNEFTQTVLDTLAFTITPGNMAAAPYPWEGQPMVVNGGTAAVGSYTLTATQLVADQSILPMTQFDNRIVTDGKLYYILTDDQLYICEKNGAGLAVKQVITLESDYSNMNIDTEGYVYISDFIEPLLVYKDGVNTAVLEDVKDYASMSPDGTFGVTYFMNWDDLEVFYADSETGSIVKEPLLMNTDPAQENYSEVFVTSNYVAVAGYMNDTENTEIALYDYDGNLFKRLTAFDADWGMGSVANFMETENYFIALDSTWETITLWDKTGVCLGEAEFDDLFGFSGYNYAYGLSQAPTGEFYISLVTERPDGSWDELLVFQLDIK